MLQYICLKLSNYCFKNIRLIKRVIGPGAVDQHRAYSAQPYTHYLLKYRFVSYLCIL
jgi:hypothetical protein